MCGLGKVWLHGARATIWSGRSGSHPPGQGLLLSINFRNRPKEVQNDDIIRLAIREPSIQTMHDELGQVPVGN